MSITDELRRYVHREMWDLPKWKDELQPIADRIDAEHERATVGCIHYDPERHYCSVHGDTEHGWVKLPVDADGEPIHVGDVVIAHLLFGGESKPLVVDRMELSRGREGDLWCVALDNDKECWNQPSILRHHYPPTVEGILRDFGVDIAHALDADPDATVPEAIIAEYAKRLRLAGEDA